MATRRKFLRGLATTMALPALPSLATSQSIPAKRMAFVYIPNGVNVKQWYGKSQSELSPSLKPLEGLKKHFSILRNLECQKAFSNGDGGGDHARANASFLTGCQIRKTAGANISVGLSVDQVAAQFIGSQTKLRSLELSTAEPRRSGRCDSGYSCAYQYNISWASSTSPAPAESNPRQVFEKLYGSGDRKADQARLEKRKSILDFVLEETKTISRKAGKEDQQKLEEYVTSVREVEKRIEAAEQNPTVAPEGVVAPQGIPESYREYVRLQFKMMKLAFQSDLTRVSTFMLGMEGSAQTFPEIGVFGKHHNLSHHRGNQKSLKDLAKIDLFYAEEFARFLKVMRDTPDGQGSLLENTMLLYGGGIKDGNRHSHSDLPLIYAGHRMNDFPLGQMSFASDNTPVCNLYLSMLTQLGMNLPRFGDSTGVLRNLI